MADLILTKDDGSISFGDYTLKEKTKLSDFEFRGDIYKVKTFRELTRLERNDVFMYESVPGTRVTDLKHVGDQVTFFVEGNGNTQITLGLEDDTEYKVSVDDTKLGKMATNVGGKLVLAADLVEGKPCKVTIERM